MATNTYQRTISSLETKLSRQRAAVESTLEMIEAVKALAEKTAREAAQTQEAPNAPQPDKPKK